MINFVTLFERTNNEILLKDVGMIPFFINADEAFSSRLVTCRMPGEYKYVETYLKGLNVEFIPCILKNEWLSGFVYVLKNAKKIDVLNLYHLKIKTYIESFFYKIFNKNGKVYLKLDIDFIALKKEDGAIKARLYKKFLESVDYCSAESKCTVDAVEKKYGKRVEYISNGFYNFEGDDQVEKENLFLTVGRLGTEQKATELLLESFAASASSHEWKLVLVGKIEESFQEYINSYFGKNQNLKERVVFTGQITDKRELLKYYRRAKVFVLPSKWESYGLVLLEALSSGCYIIGSDQIPPMQELICDGEFGEIVEYGSIEKLSEAMQDATIKDFDSKHIKAEVEYANNNYRWDYIVNKLSHDLKEICANG